METLIELYDERPLENVLGVEIFRPKRVVYVCPEKIASDRRIHEKLRVYFAHRGLDVELFFIRASVFHTEAMLRVLRRTVTRFPDCAIDITGGTDAVLFAAGLLCAQTPIPTFTYSRRRNCFYDIRNADFAEALPCTVRFSVEDCFIMAGGSLRPGRVDNRELGAYREIIEPFFKLFLSYRRTWANIVTYIQRVSAPLPDGTVLLRAEGPYLVKGDRGTRVACPDAALLSMQQIGLIRELEIRKNEAVSFRFPDVYLRNWLRDVGSVLELYVYDACRRLEVFDDLRLSAVVDWEGDVRQNAVTNEIDVMGTCGVIPVLLSCKTCEVHTEALNELAILRDRFGGKMARAAVVTTTRGGAAMRNRAGELNIEVIDLNDLLAGRLEKRLHRLLREIIKP